MCLLKSVKVYNNYIHLCGGSYWVSENKTFLCMKTLLCYGCSLISLKINMYYKILVCSYWTFIQICLTTYFILKVASLFPLNSTCPHRILKTRRHHAKQLSHFKSLFCKQITTDLNFNFYEQHLWVKRRNSVQANEGFNAYIAFILKSITTTTPPRLCGHTVLQFLIDPTKSHIYVLKISS